MSKRTPFLFAVSTVMLVACGGGMGADPIAEVPEAGGVESAREGEGDRGVPFKPFPADADGGGTPSSPKPADDAAASPTWPAAEDATPAPDPGSADAAAKPATPDAGTGDDGAPTPPVVEDAAPPSAVPTTTSRGAAIVAEIARELANKKSAVYSHTTFVDEAKGVYNFDCSGFLGYALDRAFPAGIAALRAATRARPLAEDFARFISTTTAQWSRVDRAIDLKPGDLVAWLQPADIPSANTGHAMFVYGAPIANPSRSEVIVPIADATSTPHGSSDPRTAAGATGLGVGSIGLIVDGAGKPTAFYWNGGNSGSIAHSTAITMGRAR